MLLNWKNLQQYNCPLCGSLLEHEWCEGVESEVCTGRLCGYHINSERFNEVIIGMDVATGRDRTSVAVRKLDGVIFNII